MKAYRAASAKSLSWLSVIIAIVLVGIPFHAFLTVWLASGFGHYTALRLWKEVLLIIASIIACAVVLKDTKLQQVLKSMTLFRLIAAYSGLTVIVGLICWCSSNVTTKALAYGLVVNLRFLLWFLVVWVTVQRRSWLIQHWRSLVLWPAAIVCAIGLIQIFFLPYDVLKHFGYSAATIFPYETVNHNLDYQRAMSTLRGANPLGAYLLVIVTLLAATWQRRYRGASIGLGVAAVLTLFLTFSRAAWLGLAFSAAIIGLVKLRTSPHRKLVYYSIGIIVIGLGVIYTAVQNNPAVQNAVFHTEDQSTVAVSSNQGHNSALRDGFTDVWHHPLGSGVGTAGPASVYNDGKVRIAENYYLQIGQEIGWLGLGLFVAITFFSLQALWKKRADPMALGLFAAGCGLIVVNSLSHAWVDDTLAYLWWGLAAMAIAKRLHPA